MAIISRLINNIGLNPIPVTIRISALNILLIKSEIIISYLDDNWKYIFNKDLDLSALLLLKCEYRI